MTIKTLYIGCTVAACYMAAPAKSQTRVSAEPLRIEQSYLGREGDSLRLRFTADYSGMNISSQQQLVLQPLLVRRTDTVEWPMVMLTGHKRIKANHRKEALGYLNEAPPTYERIIRVEHNRNGRIHYDAALPFRPWMTGAQAELTAVLSGCADCRQQLVSLPLGAAASETPAYAPQVMFIVPEVETIKKRTEKEEAYLNFEQGKAVILTDLGNNASELRKLNELISQVLTDPNCTCQGIELQGYASPEGNYAYNTRLSEARARSLKNQLEEKHTGARCPFSSEGRSEDWDGVRRWVEQSALPYREEVTGIIRNVQNPDAPRRPHQATRQRRYLPHTARRGLSPVTAGRLHPALYGSSVHPGRREKSMADGSAATQPERTVPDCRNLPHRLARVQRGIRNGRPVLPRQRSCQ